MPGYEPARHVTHYFVQVEDTNPLGRRIGWRTVWSENDDPEGAKARAKDERKQGHKVRIVKRAGVSGGSTRL